VVALDRRGRVTLANARARERLARYARPIRKGRLPEELERWLSCSRKAADTEQGLASPPRPLVLARGEQSLVVGRAALPGAGTVLLLDEHNKEIARRLDIAPKTVEKHLQQVYAKLGVGTRTAAAARALRAAG